MRSMHCLENDTRPCLREVKQIVTDDQQTKHLGREKETSQRLTSISRTTDPVDHCPEPLGMLLLARDGCRDCNSDSVTAPMTFEPKMWRIFFGSEPGCLPEVGLLGSHGASFLLSER